MSTEKLKQEFYYYIENQSDLVEKYDGLFLVIKDKEIQGVYKTSLEALSFGDMKFGKGNFLIKKCGAGKENYTSKFHSRAKPYKYD